jgi:hypothetical protein
MDKNRLGLEAKRSRDVAFGEGGVNYRCQRFVGISFQYPKGFLVHFEVRSALGIFGESGSLRLARRT